jgi:outer membrane murein-binding lipoprotein Lpp
MGAKHMNTIIGAVALAGLAAVMPGSESKQSQIHLASSVATLAPDHDQFGSSPKQGCIYSFFEILGQFHW